MRHERWAIGLVSVLLGFMVVSQYRMTQHTVDDSIRLQRAGDLALQLHEVETERDNLLQQLDAIKAQGTVEGVKAENDQLLFRAGLTNVAGPGVLVTISDSQAPIAKGDNPNLYLIHDEDMLRVVNELRAGGAEAIAVNDERLLGTSELRCSGPTITINGKAHGAPFVVKAIGDPETLSSALTLRGGVVDSLKHWGIQVDIQKVPDLAIPAYTGNLKKEHLVDKGRGGDAQ